jgi:hypothetical protein
MFMKGKHFALASLISVMLTLVLVPLSGQLPYDEWSDITGPDGDSDGKIDIRDIGDVAARFGTLGNPAKEVAVTNWPISSDTSVWWQEALGPSGSLASPSIYSASGFGHLHILMRGSGLGASEELTVTVGAPLWSPGHLGYYPIAAYQVDLTSTTNERDITLPVPSEEFYFWVIAGPTTSASISLSFYLTWA